MLDYTIIPMRAKDAHFLAVIARAYVEENYAAILARVGGRPKAYDHVRVDLSLTNLRETLLDVFTGAKLAILPDPCPYPTFLVHVERMQGDAPRTRVVRLTPRTAQRRVAKEGFLRVMDLVYGEPALAHVCDVSLELTPRRSSYDLSKLEICADILLACWASTLSSSLPCEIYAA